MSWIVAGLIAGVLAYLADYVMWGKVFTRGMEPYGTMERAEREMGPMLATSAALSLAWGLFFAFLYHHFKDSLWVPPGPLTGGLLNGTPCAASRSASAAASSTSRTRRFQPPGSGRVPSGIGRAAELCGPLSQRTRSPRSTIANAGPICVASRKPSRST